MKHLLKIICFFNCFIWITVLCYSQEKTWSDIDSATRMRFINYDSLAVSYYFMHADSSLYYEKICLGIALENNIIPGIIRAKTVIGYAYWLMGNYPLSIENFQKARELCEPRTKIKNRDTLLIQIYDGLGCAFCSSGFYAQGFESLAKAENLSIKINSKGHLLNELNTIGDYYEKSNQNDSAFRYLQRALKLALETKDAYFLPNIYKCIGNVYQNLDKPDSAIIYWQKNLEISSHDFISAAESHNNMGEVYLQLNKSDSAHLHISKAIELFGIVENIEGLEVSNNLMSNFFKKYHNRDSFYHYLEITSFFKDSLFNNEKRKQLNTYALNEQLHEQEQLQQQQTLKNRVKVYGLLTALIVFLIIALLLYRNNRHKQKANALLQQQKRKVESTLSELKSTQQQLIQSEKMASLGELTAGIAHEIQNPLNFVNNFSEVNKELIEELKSQKSKLKNEEIDELLNDISENEEKINHHGKRADAIVKGMLQHSRSSTGQKELTDIHTLADEYLKLSYHGLRAKDKSFNAQFETKFDASLPKINVVPQDIGRILLNLYNNAFYAVNEKKNQQPAGSYEPTVSISTKKINNKIEIKVTDNGNGIPQNIIDKIFQPFFTTKPTGQGTGLGLSLSYDIVKAHGGEIKVESNEGKGTTFIIHLII